MSYRFNPTTGLLDIDNEIDSQSSALFCRQVINEITYGEAISALKLIYSGVDGRAYVASSNETYEKAQVIGMTTRAGLENSVKEYVQFGVIQDNFFTFSGNRDLFLNETGFMTDLNPMNFKFYKKIGQSLGAGTIILNVEQTIVL